MVVGYQQVEGAGEMTKLLVQAATAGKRDSYATGPDIEGGGGTFLGSVNRLLSFF